MLFRTKYINDSPKRSDTDTYTIKAVNEHGEDEASVQIVVICEWLRLSRRRGVGWPGGVTYETMGIEVTVTRMLAD